MNTILIVGPTGAGKSTLIQKIVGYNFSEKKLLDGTK